MKQLKGLVKRCMFIIVNGGKCPHLTKIEKEYRAKYNIQPNHFSYHGNMSEALGKRIANCYESLPHDPDNAFVQSAYRQLADELLNQFNFLNEQEPIVYEAYEGEGEPYQNSYDMLFDFHNHHLYFFKTTKGFGEKSRFPNNIMLEKTGIMVGDYELLLNDIFRIVHDIFGHAMKGYTFGPKGEDNAWFTHMNMFSPMAAAALTTETRGQNCWVNFGKHLRDENGNIRQSGDPQYLPPQQRPFADQKMNVLPPDFCGVELYEDNSEINGRFRSGWNPLHI